MQKTMSPAAEVVLSILEAKKRITSQINNRKKIVLRGIDNDIHYTNPHKSAVVPLATHVTTSTSSSPLVVVNNNGSIDSLILRGGTTAADDITEISPSISDTSASAVVPLATHVTTSTSSPLVVVNNNGSIGSLILRVSDAPIPVALDH